MSVLLDAWNNFQFPGLMTWIYWGTWIIVILAAMVVFISLVLMLTAPIFIWRGYLLNNGGGDEKTTNFYMFTKISPRQVKTVERGGKFLRSIIDSADKGFARRETGSTADYWEIIDKPGGERPTADVHPLLRPWAEWVYGLTGAVFTGPSFMQTVLERPLKRVTLPEKEDRNQEIINQLVEKSDFSDHLRHSNFNFMVWVRKAETRDNISVYALLNLELEVTNSYKTYYKVDRWDVTTNTRTRGAIAQIIRTLYFNEVVTIDHGKDDGDAAEKERKARIIKDAALGLDLSDFGIKVRKADVIDVGDDLDNEADKRTLRAGGLAARQAEATVIDGEARAEAARKVAAVANESPIGANVITLEAYMKAVQAAADGKSANIILPAIGQGIGADPLQLLQLQQLQELNKNEEGKKDVEDNN